MVNNSKFIQISFINSVVLWEKTFFFLNEQRDQIVPYVTLSKLSKPVVSCRPTWPGSHGTMQDKGRVDGRRKRRKTRTASAGWIGKIILLNSHSTVILIFLNFDTIRCALFSLGPTSNVCAWIWWTISTLAMSIYIGYGQYFRTEKSTTNLVCFLLHANEW